MMRRETMDGPRWPRSKRKSNANVAATLPPALRDFSDDLDPKLIENRTDIANAKRLINAHGNDLRFCHPWGKFLVFDSHRWKLDDEGVPGYWMQAVIEEMIEETQEELNLLTQRKANTNEV